MGSGTVCRGGLEPAPTDTRIFGVKQWCPYHARFDMPPCWKQARRAGAGGECAGGARSQGMAPTLTLHWRRELAVQHGSAGRRWFRWGAPAARTPRGWPPSSPAPAWGGNLRWSMALLMGAGTGGARRRRTFPGDGPTLTCPRWGRELAVQHGAAGGRFTRFDITRLPALSGKAYSSLEPISKNISHYRPTPWSWRAHTASLFPAGSTMCHAPDRKHGWRGSMAAALQTLRHAHDRRV